MRLSDFERNMAINAFGGTSLKNASWDNAKSNLEKAVALEPNRALHHLELGRVYRDMGDTAKANAQFEATIKAPTTEYNDKYYKKSAQESLQH
jgi:Tfp pilus assembly protein PilF